MVENVHWLPMTGLLEDLGCHISWSSTCCGQDMELLLIHNSRQPEIGNQEISVVLRGPEEQILGFQIAMDDTVVVKICDSGESGADQIGSIGFVVIAFPADTVEELSAEGEISDEIDCKRLSINSRPVSTRRQYSRLFMVSK
jgi:hypothetical protein